MNQNKEAEGNQKLSDVSVRSVKVLCIQSFFSLGRFSCVVIKLCAAQFLDQTFTTC